MDLSEDVMFVSLQDVQDLPSEAIRYGEEPEPSPEIRRLYFAIWAEAVDSLKGGGDDAKEAAAWFLSDDSEPPATESDPENPGRFILTHGITFMHLCEFLDEDAEDIRSQLAETLKRLSSVEREQRMFPDRVVWRFWEFVSPEDRASSGCWNWRGPVHPNRGPYFVFRRESSAGGLLKKEFHQAARVAWELFYRMEPPRPMSSTTEWSCGNANCVNPKHVHLRHRFPKGVIQVPDLELGPEYRSPWL